MRSKSPAEDLILTILAGPVLLILAIRRSIRRWQLAQLAVAPAIICRTCGRDIPLVGFWRCRCGFTYQGHLLRYCPVCESFPDLVRCYACWATEVMPPCDD